MRHRRPQKWSAMLKWLKAELVCYIHGVPYLFKPVKCSNNLYHIDPFDLLKDNNIGEICIHYKYKELANSNYNCQVFKGRVSSLKDLTLSCCSDHLMSR
jgi:hypothetical protein